MKSVSIFGVGLIGGSFGLALRAAGFRGTILGVSSPATIDLAVQRGAIDRGASFEEAAQADLLFLAQPISVILSTIEKLGGCLGPDSVVTDAGSTKVKIGEQAQRHLRPGSFVGGHPMAGKERTGVAAADADLFRGRPWILTERGPAADAIAAWIRAIGANPRYFPADEHDRVVARTSHLPQFLATALALTLTDCSRADEISGPGASDMTRLALSSAELWRDIAFTNQEYIEQAIDAFLIRLEEIRRVIRSGNLDESFQSASESARRFSKSSTS